MLAPGAYKLLGDQSQFRERKRKCWKSRVSAVVGGAVFLMDQGKLFAFRAFEFGAMLYALWRLIGKL